MKLTDLDQLLKSSLTDFKLDFDEKNTFRELTETLSNDQLGYVKNKAFEFAQPYIEKGGVDAIRVLNWLERVIKAVQPVRNDMQIKSTAYFSPGNECRANIIRLLKQARQSINICVFTISDNDITQAILDAYKRGVDITVISDNDKANDRGSDIDYLMNKGLNVLLDRTSYHMHHKFMLVDDSILLNGSFNWTRSASDVNSENILISRDIELVALFLQEFNKLKIKLTDSPK